MKKSFTLVFAFLAIAFTSYAQTPGTWVVTGSLNAARYYASATLLDNGKVLVAGGRDVSNNAIASAELYDPATGIWTFTGNMNIARWSHTATLLPDGNVLVAGGYSTTAISDAELYDPITDVWTVTGNMNTTRVAHVATLIVAGIDSGKVLVAAGSSVCQGCTPILNSAEIYDPATELWTYTGDMVVARYWDARSIATLPDSSILVVGGVDCCPYHWINKAEIYDPINQTWTSTSGKSTPAKNYPVLLANGKVLVAGGNKGIQPNNVCVAKAELFDPIAGTWMSTADMSIDRECHTLTLLENGQVLVTGGYGGGWGTCNNLVTSELYDANTETWSLTGDLNFARRCHTATLLPNGQVLVAGGFDGGSNCSGSAISNAELYIPHINPNFLSSDFTVCQKFCINFYDSTFNDATEWQWIFEGGDPSTSAEQNPTNICYDEPGEFDVTLITTSASGVDTFYKPDYITVNATAPIPVITQVGNELTSSVADFYQWQFNTVDIPGATDQSYEVTQTGYYTVATSDVNSCVSSTTLYVEITGIENLFSMQGTFISPNPFSASSSISFSLSSLENISFHILDVQGRLIRTLANEQMSEGTHILTWNARDENSNTVSDGIYFLRIQTERDAKTISISVIK